MRVKIKSPLRLLFATLVAAETPDCRYSNRRQVSIAIAFEALQVNQQLMRRLIARFRILHQTFANDPFHLRRRFRAMLSQWQWLGSQQGRDHIAHCRAFKRPAPQIGRASCRERVELGDDTLSLESKR